jgi:hypothetical protein
VELRRARVTHNVQQTSALPGFQLHWPRIGVMSALSPKSDIRERLRNVRYVPIAYMVASIRSPRAALAMSSSEGYRNAHQCGTDEHHDKTRCPWPKPGMARKNKPAKKQQYDCNSVGDS